MTTILGIDPGSRITGFGVIHVPSSHTLRYVASGCIVTKGTDMGQRLVQIYTHLKTVIEQYQPQEVALESVFVHRNVMSALKLGQARGAAIVALNGLTLAEYAPRAVKQAVVGYGAASKTQVQQMVQTLLKLSGLPRADAADALAIAVCHAHQRQHSH